MARGIARMLRERPASAGRAAPPAPRPGGGPGWAPDGKVETAVSRIAHIARTLRTSAENYVRADATARAASARDPLPREPVGVFFAGGPVELYQLRDWLPVLEHLHESVPLVIVCTRPDGARAVLDSTPLPVRLAKGAPDLERLVREGMRAVLYVNHLERNFRMLRFAGPVHVYLGHGESDKDSSVSNQNKAYDRVFVAGPAGRERLEGALREFDAALRAPMVGRPQLDHPRAGGPGWAPDGRTVVLYAPTWEGDRPSMAYGSVATHGAAIVASLIADGAMRIIYRPHPRAGTTSPAYRQADAQVRAMLAGTDHLVDDGPYGWQLAAADACIADISSVAYDWLATGKPLLLTEPVEDRAHVPDAPLLDLAPWVTAAGADETASAVRAALRGMPPGWEELVAHYFGDTTPGAATARFEAAVRDVLAL